MHAEDGGSTPPFSTKEGNMITSEARDEFLKDLQALCERHKIYLRESNPWGIIAYEAYGEEGGFSYEIDEIFEENNKGFLFKRILLGPSSNG